MIAVAPSLRLQPVDLGQVQAGDRVREPLLVTGLTRRTAGDQPYAVLELRNRSGSIASAPFWGREIGRLEGIRRGDLVEVTGEVSLYRESPQLRVASLRLLPREGVAWSAYLPSIPVEHCWTELDRWRAEVGATRVRALLALCFEDPAFRERFQSCPASLAGHHAVLGGLLHHTWEVARIARAIGHHTAADPDLLLAGALLHDIGKLEAYTWEGCFLMTDRGSLLGHVVLGVLELERRVCLAPEPPCTAFELDLVRHLVLSHHGHLEYGAPVVPMTLEAEILHHADNASARAASMGEALRNPAHFAGAELVSNQTIWQLDRRRVFRGVSDWGREVGRSKKYE